MKSMLNTKTKAPDFSLPDQDGKIWTLKDTLGTYTLIYFYPKDDTPGCTREACAITDSYKAFEKAGIKVFGVSTDKPDKHIKFRIKYNLPFTLLSDPDKTMITAYGAAHSTGGTSRISYILDKKGMVIKSYPKVDPGSHAVEILKDIKEFK
jgi:peroxiredoxin Q/BCP